MRVGHFCIVSALVLLAGCLSPALSSTDTPTRGAATRGGVFVALVDSGINPWHAAFRAKDGAAPRIPVPYETVPASFKSVLASVGLDAWNQLRTHQLYWFEGTRVLAISLQDPAPLPALKVVYSPNHSVYDDVNHGTATASVVARMCPDCWIVAVKGYKGAVLPSVEWAANGTWIDVISMSVGSLGHSPDPNSKDPYAAALLRGVRSGQLVVHSGGNDPSPNLLDESGAPWVISVGGARGDEHGVVPYASQPVDVVADYLVQGLARNNSDTATFTGDGTSFGAPIVAGVLGQALYELRTLSGQAGGIRDGALVDGAGLRVTNLDVRRALNLTARYWNTTEYAPVVDPARPIDLVDTATPVPPMVPGAPVGPWLQMGWGYVDGNTTRAIVRLLAGESRPPEKAEAAAYMAQVDAARQELWALRQST